MEVMCSHAGAFSGDSWTRYGHDAWDDLWDRYSGDDVLRDCSESDRMYERGWKYAGDRVDD